MNRPIKYLALTGSLTSLICTLSGFAAEPDKRDPSNPAPGAYRDKTESGSSRRGGSERDQSPQGFVRSALLGGLKEVRMSELALERSERPEVKAFAQRIIQDHRHLNSELAKLAEKRGWNVPVTNLFDSPNPVSGSASGSEDAKKPRADGSVANEPKLPGSPTSPNTDRVRRDTESDREKHRTDVTDDQTGEARWEQMQAQGRMSIERLKNLPTGEFEKGYVREMLRGHQSSVRKYEQASQHNTDEEVRKYAKDALPQLREHSKQASQLAQSLGVSVEQDVDGKSPRGEVEKRRQQ